jgi:hypothetical protein
MTARPDRPRAPGPERPAPSLPEPVYCTLGETLCRVRVWTEEEWAALDPADRPTPAEHVPGLGWIVPVPDQGPF